jgi:hypothetical protein
MKSSDIVFSESKKNGIIGKITDSYADIRYQLGYFVLDAAGLQILLCLKHE